MPTHQGLKSVHRIESEPRGGTAAAEDAGTGLEEAGRDLEAALGLG